MPIFSHGSWLRLDSSVATLKRDGIELRTNFTAQVDVELTVSQLLETITVEGATPLVDVQMATQQRIGISKVAFGLSSVT